MMKFNYWIKARQSTGGSENHEKNIYTRSDLLYWRTLFGKTRVNRAKKQYEKGLIQLNFEINE